MSRSITARESERALPVPEQKLRIGFIEPHLKTYGGIRRVLELGNQLVELGHEVSYLLPEGAALECSWMECRGAIRSLEESRHLALDALIFNHEPQWLEPARFSEVRLRVFFALHYAVLYGKESAWESLRAPVDLLLANSSWTADCVEAEIGIRPRVLVGGVNPEHFRPSDQVKEYQVLAMGGDRPWKGTQDIRDACRMAGLRLETFSGKNISQSKLYREYGKAEVFAQGSWFEGFGQPGLEALACGIPLVTTDCGGARDYAIHEETALVVPRRDPGAMATALDRLLRDRDLAERLSRNGLALVRERFSWSRSARELADVLQLALKEKEEQLNEMKEASDGTGGESRVEGVTRSPGPLRYEPPGEVPIDRPSIRANFEAIATRVDPAPALGREPELVSIIALSWEQPHLTRTFVESIRANTEGLYELILVDNGSSQPTQEMVQELADVAVLNGENLGFAGGCNRGLAAARGEFVVFLNNDTRVPPGWLRPLLEGAALEDVGIVAPAVTNANGWVSVRRTTCDRVSEILPFSEPPPAVCYVMRRALIEELGGWSEEYRLGSGEDIDLCFTSWVHGYRLLLDERVLVEHVGKGTAGTMLEDWRRVWKENKEQFYRKWILPDDAAPVEAASASPSQVERRQAAGSVALALQQRDELARRLSEQQRRAQEDRRRFASLALQARRRGETGGKTPSVLVQKRWILENVRSLVLDSPAEAPARFLWRRLKRLRRRVAAPEDLGTHSHSELARLQLGHYAFIDAGTSGGGGLDFCARVFQRGPGLGLDRDPKKVQQALSEGRRAAVCDLTSHAVPPRCVSYVSMMDFLEHLPDAQTAEQVLENMARAARDFLFIRHPSFEDIEYLADLGLKLGWTDWTGHTNPMRLEDLRAMLERLGLRDVRIIAQKPIADSSHSAMVAVTGPRDVVRYERALHGPKPEVAFDRPVYTQFDLLVRLTDDLREEEWSRMVAQLCGEGSKLLA